MNIKIFILGKINFGNAFLNLSKYININLVTNIICLRDSLIELEECKILGSKLNEYFGKKRLNLVKIWKLKI